MKYIESINWLTDLQPKETVFIQTNTTENINNNVAINADNLIKLFTTRPIMIIGNDGTVNFTETSPHIKNIKFNSHIISAELIDSGNYINYIDDFISVINKISNMLNIKNFCRIGVRRQYIYKFEEKSVRDKFFGELLPFKNFIDVGIVKSMYIDKSIAKIQILPSMEQDIIIDIDLFIDEKNQSIINIDSLNSKIRELYGQFNKAIPKIFE